MAEIRVGISGWRYEGWRKTFYPKDLPQRRELEFASRIVNTIEINGSFYSLQTPENYRHWYESTPEDFIFSVKGSRYITHMKKLRNVRQPLANFFASGVLALEDKLGPLLWQLPPSLVYDPDLIEEFCELLPRDFESAARLAKKRDAWMRERTYVSAQENYPIRHCMEVRNPSFQDAGFIHILREQGVSLVVADAAKRWPYLEDITADFTYVRLHGDSELYVSGYDDAALNEWARRMRRWQSGRPSALSRCVAEPLKPRKGRDLFVYFDNDAKVHAPFNAVDLYRRLGDPTGRRRASIRALEAESFLRA